MKKQLSGILAALVLLACMLPMASAQEKTTFSSLSYSFATDEDLNILTGGATYYKHSTEEGVDGNAGSLSLPGLSGSVTTGFSYPEELMPVGGRYKLSFWVKNVGEEKGSISPVLMIRGGKAEVTFKGNSNYAAGTIVENVGMWAGLDSLTVAEPGQWMKYETEVYFEDNFTLGSLSKVRIESYDSSVLYIRGEGTFLADNMVIEPCYEYSTVEKPSATGWVEGEEMMTEARRYFTSVYNNNTQNMNNNYVTDATANSNGRIRITKGGFDGNTCFMGVGKASSQIRLQNTGAESYINAKHFLPNTMYKLQVWMKAPEYTEGGENALHINGTTGEVKTNTNSQNGIIGENASLYIYCVEGEGDTSVPMWTPFTIVGSYDADGKFTEGATAITSEWRMFEGYTYLPSTMMLMPEDNTSTVYPTVVARFKNAGIFMLDDISLKPITNANNNLINGDFSLKNGKEALFYPGTTLMCDSEYTSYVQVKDATPEILVNAEKDKTYKVSFAAKSDEADAKVYAKMAFEDEEVVLSSEGAALTNEWQTYEYTFTSEKETAPAFSVYTDEGKNLCVAEMFVGTEAKIKQNVFRSLQIDGVVAEKHTLTVSFEYVTDLETDYFVRVGRGNSTGYFTVSETVPTDGVASYTVTQEDIGKELLFEVFAVNETGIHAVCEKKTEVMPEISVVPEITGWNRKDAVVEGTLTVTNNRVDMADMGLFAVMVLVDENERVLGIEQVKNIHVPAGSTVETAIEISDCADKKPKYARLYVWNGKNVLDTDMDALADEVEYALQ